MTTGIPAKAMVSVGPTPYFCYFKSKKGRHHRERVTVGEHALHFFQNDKGDEKPEKAEE